MVGFFSVHAMHAIASTSRAATIVVVVAGRVTMIKRSVSLKNIEASNKNTNQKAIALGIDQEYQE